MSLVIPDDILRAANMSAGELRREIALLLFQQDKLANLQVLASWNFNSCWQGATSQSITMPETSRMI